MRVEPENHQVGVISQEKLDVEDQLSKQGRWVDKRVESLRGSRK